MTNIYLAHNYGARFWLKEKIVPLFDPKKFHITSRWLDAVKNVDADDAEMDLDDIDKADVLILFAEDFEGVRGKGKYIEFGYATGIPMDRVVIGEDTTCIFFNMMGVRRYQTIEDFLTHAQTL